MKVYIGPYKSWFGPYQLAEKLCWWVPKVPDEYGIMDKPKWVHLFGEWLAYGSIEPEPKPGDNTPRPCYTTRPETWLYRLLTWIDSKRSPTVYVRIDPWDTWTADTTLSHIILPLLKQIKLKKQGAPHVDDEDVPDYLRSTSAPAKENEYDIDNNHFKRWDWVMDEMIWAFEQHQPDYDWQDQYYSGVHDTKMVPCEWDAEGKPKLYKMQEGPKHTWKADWDAIATHQKRIDNGFRFIRQILPWSLGLKLLNKRLASHTTRQ